VPDAVSTSVSDGGVGLAGSAGFAASSACAPRVPRAKRHSNAPARARRKRLMSKTSSKWRDKSRVTGMYMTQNSVKEGWQGSPPWAAETLRISGGALLDVLAVQRYVEPFP